MAEDFYVFRRAGRDNLYVQFRNPRTGKLGSAHSSGKTSEAAAIRWAKAELREAASKVDKRLSSETTLKEWAGPFFGSSCPYTARKKDEGREYSSHYLSDSRDYLEQFVLDDEIADIPLSDLRRRDILAWRSRVVAANGSRRSSQRALQMLKLVLNEAVYQELIEYSPASKVSPPAYTPKPRSAIALDSLAKLLAPTMYTEPRHWMATVTAAFTGMRASEVRALEWHHLDFDKRLIYVTQAFKDQTSRLGPPKSGKPRVAPMSESLAALLLAWKSRSDGRWVFGFSENRPLGYKQWIYAVKKAAKAAGCEGATIHHLRHTLNTYLRGSGADDERLRASFGWSGADVQAGYSHPEFYDYRDQAAAIDRIIKIGGPDEKG